LKRVVILGSTGSIGRAAVEVISSSGGDFEVMGLACGSNVPELARQLREFPKARFTLRDEEALNRLLEIDDTFAGRNLGTGDGALVELIEESEPDIIVNALVGVSGLTPTIKALDLGIPVALANKETIVAGGEYIFSHYPDARELILPVDSEHFSLSRCLRGNSGDVVEIIITASGGPFYRKEGFDLSNVSIEEVLKHPTWNMGKKVTVDSASLFNKGLEVIEAHWLFDFPYASISVLIHPQSMVHSAVRLRDGSLLAHLAPCDMKLPIMSALYHPEVVPFPWENLGLDELASLEFAPLEKGMFPAFDLAIEAAHKGGTSTVVLNAADEVAVNAFLNGRIGFLEIVEILENTLSAHKPVKIESVDDIFLADRWARDFLNESYRGLF